MYPNESLLLRFPRDDGALKKVIEFSKIQDLLVAGSFDLSCLFPLLLLDLLLLFEQILDGLGSLLLSFQRVQYFLSGVDSLVDQFLPLPDLPLDFLFLFAAMESVGLLPLRKF